MSVDLPAPLGPTTATRDAIEHCADAFTSVYFSRVGYLKLAPVSLRIAFVLDLMPSSGPGCRNFESCEMTIDVHCVSEVRYVLSHATFFTSRWFVGSSSSSMSAPESTARASASFIFQPPESEPIA